MITLGATFWETESCTFLEPNGTFLCIHLIFKHVYFIFYIHAVSVHEDENVYRVATEKHNPNSRTFQDIPGHFSCFPGLWPAFFQGLFQDLQANARTFPGLFTKIKNFD